MPLANHRGDDGQGSPGRFLCNSADQECRPPVCLYQARCLLPTAVWVPNFGYKGEGKHANYGIPIPPPTVARPLDIPPPDQPASSSEDMPTAQAVSFSPTPTPIAPTTDDVEDWITSGYTPLTNISAKVPPEVDEMVLWRGVKLGKRGGQSTQSEYFNGKVRGIFVDPDTQELFLEVD